MVGLGGLHILGTERHESRRIDNQLRGRAGRQGDPGCSRFYLSLEDDLMRIFGGDRMQNLMQRLGMEEDVPIEQADHQAHRKAQKAVEAQNFAIRKHLLEYDDVMNKQRQAIYGCAASCSKARTRKSAIYDIVDGIVGLVHRYRAAPTKSAPNEWDLAGLRDRRHSAQFGARDHGQGTERLRPRPRSRSCILDTLLKKRYEEKEAVIGAEVMRETERMIMLNVHRQPVEGSPAVDGPPEGRHRPARLRPEGPAGRVQEGSPSSCSRT